MPAHADLIADAAGHRSPRLTALGVPHVFGTRRHPVPDARAARALADAAGLPPGPVHLGSQCHGRDVTTPDTRHTLPQADAHLAERSGDRAGDLVAVRTADCVPVLLASADGRCVVAVHAGWRGLVAGVIEAAAAAMLERGGGPLAAAVGPCIGVNAYEIGPEVATQFARAHLVRPSDSDSDSDFDSASASASARPHLDLRRAATARLLDLGLAAADIDVSTACTHRDSADFFSYRRATQSGREGGTERGHQASIIGPAGP